MDQLVKIWARIVRKSDGEPICGRQYTVKLYDKDVLVDDRLGEARLDDQGYVQLTFDLSQVASFDSPFESKPDLYIVVHEGDKAIFRSPVFEDVDFLKRDSVTDEMKQITQDLGTFEI